MSKTDSRAQIKTVIGEYWARVFNYSYRMTLDRDRTRSIVEETFLRAYVGLESLPHEPQRIETWLYRIATHVLEGILPRTPELSFDQLDETLRSEATRTDVVRSLTDPQRDFSLWELKQGCMTSVINCLSPGERSAFIMANILKMSEEEAAAALGVNASAYKVRLSRARKKVGDYLAPRCEHVNPLNPCRCPARVGVAIRKGFIRPMGEVSLRKNIAPFGRYGSGPEHDDEPLRDIETIYSNLPDPDENTDIPDHLCSLVDSGVWDRVRDKKGAASS